MRVFELDSILMILLRTCVLGDRQLLPGILALVAICLLERFECCSNKLPLATTCQIHSGRPLSLGDVGFGRKLEFECSWDSSSVRVEFEVQVFARGGLNSD